jgi:hypothetical protein
MDMERLDRRYRQLKRANVARSALDTIALIFLGCAFAFWSVAFWQLLAPPALLSLLSIQAVVLALVYSLATPLLWSALVPTTPAGQLLQKTQWRTIGFYLIIGAALYLSYQAEWMIELWLSYQPGVVEAGMARSLAFSLSIGFILIPALAWTQLNPERWLQQIQQAHQVRRLEIQQRGDLAILKSRMLWAKQKAATSYANLLPAERQEIVDTMRGLFMSIADTQRDIAGTLGLSADLERSIMDDTQIADQLDYVAKALDAQAVVPYVPPAIKGADNRTPDPPERAERAFVAHTESLEGTCDADRPRPSQTIAHDGEYTIAHEHFGRTGWRVKQLADVLGIEPETAAKRRREWEDAGLVTGKGQSTGCYRFVGGT